MVQPVGLWQPTVFTLRHDRVPTYLYRDDGRTEKRGRATLRVDANTYPCSTKRAAVAAEYIWELNVMAPPSLLSSCVSLHVELNRHQHPIRCVVMLSLMDASLLDARVGVCV